MKVTGFTLIVLSCILVLVRASPSQGDKHWQDWSYKHHHSAIATPVQGQTLKGTPYPPSPILITGGDEQDDDEGPSFPVGQPIGPIVPSSPHTTLSSLDLTDTSSDGTPRPAKRQSCSERASLLFGQTTIFGNNTGQPSEPSGATAGNITFTSANFIAAVSFDGGVTFNTFDPTVYSGPANPATDNGFCCDQIVQYLPSIDRFVWLMQYWANSANQDKVRLITFHPSDLTTTGINSWIYLDILSTDLSLVNLLDAGELAVGIDYLWFSANNNNGNTGLIVLRIPIAALDVVGSFTYWHTDATLGQPAYLSRLSQNPGDTLFWAGHTVLGTTLRIFKWPESGTTYFWSDLRINDWPSNGTNYAAFCPGGSSTDWTFSADFKAVLGSTRRTANEVWFAWGAPSGGGFPNVHIQIAQIDVSNWPTLVLIRQPQIWNPSFAFVYPALYTNQCGDVGVAVMFGGGVFNPSSAVGVMTSAGVLTNTVYYPELSNVCEDRYGDYVTVRSADGIDFEGFIYAEQSVGGSIGRNSRYISYRRG